MGRVPTRRRRTKSALLAYSSGRRDSGGRGVWLPHPDPATQPATRTQMRRVNLENLAPPAVLNGTSTRVVQLVDAKARIEELTYQLKQRYPAAPSCSPVTRAT